MKCQSLVSWKSEKDISNSCLLILFPSMLRVKFEKKKKKKMCYDLMNLSVSCPLQVNRKAQACTQAITDYISSYAT